MARLPRLFAPGAVQLAAHHVLANEFLTRSDADAEQLTASLVLAAQKHRLDLHAFVVLPRAVRLLASAKEPSALPDTMQALGRSYVASYNKRYQRRGPLWHGRFRSTVIDADIWLLDAMAAIECAPMREGLVADPAHYAFSSYRQHIGLATGFALVDHSAYWRLGNTPFERQRVYLAHCEEPLPKAREGELWAAVAGGWVLGSTAFADHLSQQGARRTTPLPRGRRKTIALPD